MSAGVPPPPPLDQHLRALLRRAATVEPAPAGARARLRVRLEALVGPFGGGDGGGGAGGDGHHGGPETGTSDGGGLAAHSALSSGTLSLVASAPLLRRILPLVASFALGGSTGVLLVRARPDHAPPVVYVDRFVDRPVAAAPEIRAPDPQPPPAAEAPPPTRARPASGFTAERLLLDVAREALERDQPAAALAAATRHARRYPGGILAQEREVMAIRALASLHRGGEARQRAARFRARFPGSLFLPAIDAAIAGSEPRP